MMLLPSAMCDSASCSRTGGPCIRHLLLGWGRQSLHSVKQHSSWAMGQAVHMPQQQHLQQLAAVRVSWSDAPWSWQQLLTH